MISIKTPQEIELMRQSGKILLHVLQEMEKQVRPGISTKELDTIAEEIIRSSGAVPTFKGYHGFPGTLCTSINDQVVHGIPSDDEVLKEGDIIGVDCGVTYKGLITDACRTFIAGDVSPEVRHFVDITKKSLENAIQMVKPGGFIGDISYEIQRTLEEYGYSPVIECTGHGVGKELHEAPEILNVGKSGTGPEIHTGMTFAIEPISTMKSGEIMTLPDKWTIVTRDGSLSAHFEHTVAVTGKGMEIIV